jgi:hypothetical protein
MNEHVVLEKYLEIITDFKGFIQSDDFIEYKFEDELYPDDIDLHWSRIDTKRFIANNLSQTSKPSIPEESRNILCKKCSDRVSAIRGFIHKGNMPILVLHFTGEISPTKKVFSKMGKNQIFRDSIQEDLFDRMIKKIFFVGMRDLYYQEFPGCNFKNQTSTITDWELRTKNCLEHVEKTVKNEGIKGIIITGRAAVSYFGFEKAESLLEKILPFELGKFSIPSIVIRSPEKILHLEEIKKKYEKKKESQEYKTAVEEEKIIKLQVVNSLTEFKNQVLV